MDQTRFRAMVMAIFLAFVGPFSASAQTQVNPLATKIYSDHFWKYNTVDNMPWDCGGNSYDLFLKLNEGRAIEGSESFIVHAFYEKNFKLDQNNKPLSRVLIPKTPRAGQPRWAFHAALVIDGLVFDQYYTTQPKVLDFANYIQQMWGAENLQALKFQIVPTAKYHEVVQSGYSVPEEEYPVMNFYQIQELLGHSR